MKHIAIVVPIYNKTPKLVEQASLSQLNKVNNSEYDIIYVCPESWGEVETQPYEYIISNASFAKFDDSYFTSTASYSQLLKNVEFYNRFSDYDYMLICQTDAWALSFSDLQAWADEGYDYVGAPIVANAAHWPSMPCCGNGGLSLRKVSSFIEYTSVEQAVQDRLNSNPVWKDYEDVYFCDGMSQYLYIDMPEWMTAGQFAYDMNPDVVYERIGVLPQVGIHAWPKNLPFWEHIIEIDDATYKEAYEANKEFIDAYYMQHYMQH